MKNKKIKTYIYYMLNRQKNVSVRFDYNSYLEFIVCYNKYNKDTR